MEKSELRKQILRAKENITKLKQIKVDTVREKERQIREVEIIKQKIKEMENELYGLDKR